jgi:hypothetical protein
MRMSRRKWKKKIVVKDLMNVLGSNQTMSPKGGSKLMHFAIENWHSKHF